MIHSFSIPQILLEVTAATTSENVFHSIANMSPLEQLLAGLCIAVLLGGFFTMYKLSSNLMELQKIRLLEKHQPELLEKAGIEIPTEITESWWSKLYKRMTDNVPLEKEEDILLDHNYDGVMELDNNLPPWWKAVFYISVAFAPVYLYFNHFSDNSMSSREAYAVEMEAAEAAVKAFLATQADLVDETNVTLLTDEVAMASGKAIFDNKCSVCHGKLGEGGIGPNLTDVYWLHGGSVQDVFKTIKYGVPEMGMQAWNKNLRPANMQEVASYILSLAGTNPPNPKEPQGEVYTPEEQIAAEADNEEPQGK